MDLSKKNRAVAAVCVIVACLVDLMNDQVSFYKDCKERASHVEGLEVSFGFYLSSSAFYEAAFFQ